MDAVILWICTLMCFITLGHQTSDIWVVHIVIPPQESSDEWWPNESVQFSGDVIRNRSDILQGYNLRIHTTYAGSQDVGEAFKAFIDAVRDDKPTKLMIIGPTFTSQAKIIAEMAKYYHIVQIGYSITSPVMTDLNKYPYFARVSQSTSLRNPPMIEIIKKYGWTRMATIGRSDEFIGPSMEDFQRLMKLNNFTLLATASYDSDPTPQVKQLKDADARIMIGYPWLRSGTKRIECEIFKNGLYGRKYQWFFWSCSFPSFTYNSSRRISNECDYDERKLALEGALCFEGTTENEEMNGGIVGDSGMTLKELQDNFRSWSLARYNRSYGLYGRAFEALWTAAKALNASVDRLASLNNSRGLEDFTYEDKEMADVLLDELKKLDYWGPTGHVAFDDNGDRFGLVVINQIRDLKYERIATYDPQIMKMEWHREMYFRDGRPPYDSVVEKITRIETDKTVFAVMASLSAIGMLFCIVCIIFNIIYRELRYIKLSSPRLNSLIAGGCFLSYLSVILIGLTSQQAQENSSVCYLRVWVLVTAFTFAFGSMFAKTWRVHVLFTNKKLTRKVVKDGHLFAMVGVVWMIDIFILTLWAALDPPVWLEKKLRGLPEADDGVVFIIPIVTACSSTYQNYWMGALFGYKGLLILFGIFFAWETRAVRVEGLNDSRQIGICVYNVMIMSALTLPMVYILTDSQINIIYSIISAAILICATSTLGFVFVSKMYLIILHGNKVDDVAILPFASSLRENTQNHSNRPSTISGVHDSTTSPRKSAGTAATTLHPVRAAQA